MKKTFMSFLQVLTVLFGALILFWMIRLPQTEGRAANLDLISIYKDPFIIYIYIASIIFFVGLYQVFKLLGFLSLKNLPIQKTIISLGIIKNCALIMIAFILGALVSIMSYRGEDDIAGGVATCLFLIFVSILVASFAAVIQSRLAPNSKR